jgi:hypothetical protein
MLCWPKSEKGQRELAARAGVVMPKRAKPTVYLFKVALQGAKRIWRKIAVRSDQTLDAFHGAIFKAFDRYDEHLYSFYFPQPGSRGREVLRNAVEYTHPYNAEQDDFFGDRPPHNAAKTPLRDLHLVPEQTFLYLFDFGDDWWHEVKVERTDAPVEAGSYPRIVDRRGESPPQYPEDDEDE